MFYIVSSYLANRVKLEHSYASMSDYAVEIKQETPMEVSLEDVNSINTEIDLGVVIKSEDLSDDCSQLSAHCDLPSVSERSRTVFISGSMDTMNLKSNVLNQSRFKMKHGKPMMPIDYKLHLKILKDLNTKLKQVTSTADTKRREMKQQMSQLRKKVTKLRLEQKNLKRKEQQSLRQLRVAMEKKHVKAMKFREILLDLKRREIKDAQMQINKLSKLLVVERQRNLKYSKQNFQKLQKQTAQAEDFAGRLVNTLKITRNCLVKKEEESKTQKARANLLTFSLKLKDKEIAQKDGIIKNKEEALRTKVCNYCGF